MKLAIISTLAICLLSGCSGSFKAGYQLEANWKAPRQEQELKKKD